MRIISGKYRGKKLFSPKSDKVRPTSDRARESLFNIIRDEIDENTKVLDVFAGTGALGFEALSRGALRACFVDIDVDTLKKNASLFENEKNNIEIIKADALKIFKAKDKYNLVFLDAPYNKGFSVKALEGLYDNGWIESNALVVVEVEKNEEFSSFFEPFDTRVYGLNKLLFFRIS